MTKVVHEVTKEVVKEKNKKLKMWLIFGAVAVVAIVSVYFIFFANKELDVSEEIEPKFSGYSERGSLSYDSDKVTESITEYLLKEEGFKQDVIDGLIREDDNVIYSVLNNPDLSAKVSKVENNIDGITFGFDKSSDLKNGDKVVFSLEKSSEEIPVKEFKKEFTVKGLKESKHITLDEIIKENPLTFEGFNGAGELKSVSIENSDTPLFDTPEGNKGLSNGDKVKIKVNESYISQLEEEGTILDGENETTVTVSNLKDFSSISNIDEILSLIDDVAKSENKDKKYEYANITITHNLERVGSYISQSNKGEEGELYFNIVSIYKVDVATTKEGKDESETHYAIYGYSGVPYVNEKLSSNDLQKYSGFEFGGDYKDEASAVSAIKASNSNFSELDK